MALDFPIISSDDHVQEPPDLWMSRLPKSLAERGPRIERQPDGRDRWLVDGEVLAEWPVSRARAISNGDRYLDIETWDQVPAASYDPAERLKAMDEDGIAAAVLYPYIAGLGGEILGAIKDPELQAACVDTYNDWLLETWSSDRLVPQALVPISSIEAARAGAVKAVKAGHKGIVLPAAPWRINDGTPHLYDPDWDLFWKQIGDLDVPVCFHSGSVPSLMMHIYEGFDPAVAKAFDVVRRPSSSGMIVCRFLFSGVGERHPDVKFVFSATGIDWFAFMLEVSDHEWERICLKGENVEMKTAPSEIFHRQGFVTTSFDQVGLKLLYVIGAKNVMWYSEFPLESSTFPDSAKTLEKNYADVVADERRAILHDNAAGLYGIKA